MRECTLGPQSCYHGFLCCSRWNGCCHMSLVRGEGVEGEGVRAIM